LSRFGELLESTPVERQAGIDERAITINELRGKYHCRCLGGFLNIDSRTGRSADCAFYVYGIAARD
jgi:hypothetical protein